MVILYYYRLSRGHSGTKILHLRVLVLVHSHSKQLKHYLLSNQYQLAGVAGLTLLVMPTSTACVKNQGCKVKVGIPRPYSPVGLPPIGAGTLPKSL